MDKQCWRECAQWTRHAETQPSRETDIPRSAHRRHRRTWTRPFSIALSHASPFYQTVAEPEQLPVSTNLQGLIVCPFLLFPPNIQSPPECADRSFRLISCYSFSRTQSPPTVKNCGRWPALSPNSWLMSTSLRTMAHYFTRPE